MSVPAGVFVVRYVESAVEFVSTAYIERVGAGSASAASAAGLRNRHPAPPRRHPAAAGATRVELAVPPDAAPRRRAGRARSAAGAATDVPVPRRRRQRTAVPCTPPDVPAVPLRGAGRTGRRCRPVPQYRPAARRLHAAGVVVPPVPSSRFPAPPRNPAPPSPPQPPSRQSTGAAGRAALPPCGSGAAGAAGRAASAARGAAGAQGAARGAAGARGAAFAGSTCAAAFACGAALARRPAFACGAARGPTGCTGSVGIVVVSPASRRERRDEQRQHCH